MIETATEGTKLQTFGFGQALKNVSEHVNLCFVILTTNDGKNDAI